MTQSAPSLLIGDYIFKNELFQNHDLNSIFVTFHEPEFVEASNRKRFKMINVALLNLILKAPEESFLLMAVLDFINRVNHEKIMDDSYTLVLFEFWLNNFSRLSDQENYQVRAKLMGKKIPREDYQAFFPIGMNKTFSGTHFVTAHIAPDVDTTIASFWGWVDAFACRVGDAQHIWNLPGEPPESHVITIFKSYFGESVFANLTRTLETLTLTGLDLVKQNNVVKETGHTLISALDHNININAIIYIDDKGHYLGDWRNVDVERIRQIVVLFKNCLRWFQNNLQVNLFSSFGKEDFNKNDIPKLISSLFNICIKGSEPCKEYDEGKKKHLNDFLINIIQCPKGIRSSFSDLFESISKLEIYKGADFRKEIEALNQSDLFKPNGILKENRSAIFNCLEKIFKSLDLAIQNINNYIDRLDVVMSIKKKILGDEPQYVTMRSDVEEIRVKINNYDYLTVVLPENDGSLFPLGIVSASDIRKTILGTVTLRDFCNQEEIKMASYLEVISVIDHHKSSLKTGSPPLALIGDTQSCNVLIAEQAFIINDRYSLGGIDEEVLQIEFNKSHDKIPSSSSLRVMQKVLQREMAIRNRGSNYIHPNREILEYFCFLHAILDDTDLLSKVSNRDIECVVSLLNRLKSLTISKEIEILNLEDIPKDNFFAKLAAKRILQNQEMYSIYKKIYDYKEKEVEINLNLFLNGQNSNIFLDTKEQNGCCRVGQTKMFSTNYNSFLENAHLLRSLWYQNAEKVYKNNPQIDLHIHMISTISSAEEVYSNNIGNYNHQDEIWIWVPSTQMAFYHLTGFLNAFQSSPEIINNKIEVIFQGSNAIDLNVIFKQNCPEIINKIENNEKEMGIPIAILLFKAGLLNSRKSMITPYLPYRIG